MALPSLDPQPEWRLGLPPARWMFRLVNLYPPYIGAGIRVRSHHNWTVVDVSMRLRFWNRNAVGTHFGGSLYSMCDPFYMLVLMRLLGRDYIVWDKSASIRFRKPGKGTVRARFEVSDQQLEEIKATVESEGRCDYVFNNRILSDSGVLVADLEKVIYVRAKEPR